MRWKKLPVVAVLFLAAFVSASLSGLERSRDQLLSDIGMGLINGSAEFIDMIPFAYSSTQDLLLGCDTLIYRVSVGATPRQRSEVIIDACAGIVAELIQRQPTSSLAHYLSARLAANQEDHARYMAAFSKSQEFGKFEGWLSARRFKLVVSNANFDEHVGLITNEIVSMFRFQSGTEELANQFFTAPALRELFPIALQQASAQDRQRFLNILENHGDAS